jgi:transposase InsO family protein
MTETDLEIILQRARKSLPAARLRIISDNGSQFVARDFKLFIRECWMTRVRSSPAYPQSNSKLERWHKTLKVDAIRTKTPLILEAARRVVDQFVKYYNEVRLHSAIGYVAPKDRLSGRDQHILTERKRKLAQARKLRRQQHHNEPTIKLNSSVQLVIPDPQNSIFR